MRFYYWYSIGGRWRQYFLFTYFIYLFSVTWSLVCCETANSFLTVDQKVIKLEQLSFCFHLVFRWFGFFLVTSDEKLTVPLLLTWPVQSLVLTSSSWIDKGFLCVRWYCRCRPVRRKMLRASSSSAANNREEKKIKRMKILETEKMRVNLKVWEWVSGTPGPCGT